MKVFKYQSLNTESVIPCLRASASSSLWLEQLTLTFSVLGLFSLSLCKGKTTCLDFFLEQCAV